MKFTRAKAKLVAWDDLKLWSYNEKEDFARASAAYFEVGPIGHGKVKSEVSDRVYYVIEGKGVFVIDGEAIRVEATDVVIIPKNTPYDYRASNDTLLKLFLVHTPAFNREKEIKL